MQDDLKYTHLFGNEATESLLAEYGIMEPGSSTKNRILSEKLITPKQCPNCFESNIPDCKFCTKCKMILTYSAYEETLEEQKKKDKRLEDLQKSLQAQLQTQQNQQKILETIWNNMASAAASKEDEKRKKNNQHYNDDDNNIHVSKLSLTWQMRREEKEPPITAAETFVLSDGKNNKLAKDMCPEEIGQLPWRTLVSQEELRKRLSS
jgi:hypothetical protein